MEPADTGGLLQQERAAVSAAARDIPDRINDMSDIDIKPVKAIRLDSIKADLEVEKAGEWISYPDWPGVKFHVSSIHLPAYDTAVSLAVQKLAKRYMGEPVPPEENAKVLGRLLCDHLLHGWTGFDIAYSKQVAEETLTDLAFRQVRDAVEWCARRVGVSDVEFAETQIKNSGRLSAGD